jgi:Fe-S cluster biosynthesis and repair protein YggX
MATVQCVRCGKVGERQAFRPFPTPLGERVYDTICRDCWAAWLMTQRQLINHYALVPHEPEAKAFLLHHMEQFLFGEGTPGRVQ